MIAVQDRSALLISRRVNELGLPRRLQTPFKHWLGEDTRILPYSSGLVEPIHGQLRESQMESHILLACRPFVRLSLTGCPQ